MTREQLVGRLRLIETDLDYGRHNAAVQSLRVLIGEIKAAGVEAPLRSRLADFPPGTELTIKIGG